MNNLTYHAVDLGTMIQRRDPLLVDLFDSLMLQFARGNLIPSPTSVMPVLEIAAAQRAQHQQHG